MATTCGLRYTEYLSGVPPHPGRKAAYLLKQVNVPLHLWPLVLVQIQGVVS